MLYNFLVSEYETQTLHNAYLIASNDVLKYYAELERFLDDKIYNDQCVNGDKITQIDQEMSDDDFNPKLVHSDFLLLHSFKDVKSKILIDQVREFIKFLHISTISNIRVGVIMLAENMTLSSMNACLKLLEDPPNNVHLFVFTEKIHILPKTITSRCKLFRCYDNLIDIKYEKNYLDLICPDTDFSKKIPLINSIKNKKEFSDFCKYLFTLLYKYLVVIYDAKDIYDKLDSSEQKILINTFKFQNSSHYFLFKKLDNLYKKIDDTLKDVTSFETDIFSAIILIISLFDKNINN